MEQRFNERRSQIGVRNVVKMENEIVNKVANSSLEVFDLEDYYTIGTRVQIDISQWLEEGFLLKEKDFRAVLKNYSWNQYQDCLVAIHCATDAIIPAWAIILVATYVIPFAKKTTNGLLIDLETNLYQEILATLDYSIYQDKAVILKGCSKKPVPEAAYVMALEHLLPVCKSIMYGEACSAVPLFKKVIAK